MCVLELRSSSFELSCTQLLGVVDMCRCNCTVLPGAATTCRTWISQSCGKASPPVLTCFSLTVSAGVVKVGEEVDIVGMKAAQKSTVTGVEMFKKLLNQGQAGDNVGLLLRGLKRDDILRGQVGSVLWLCMWGTGVLYNLVVLRHCFCNWRVSWLQLLCCTASWSCILELATSVCCSRRITLMLSLFPLPSTHMIYTGRISASTPPPPLLYEPAARSSCASLAL